MTPQPPTPPQDEDLLARLRAIAAVRDPVPPEVEAAARAALSWRTLDAQLAELTHDSLLKDGQLVGVRGAATLRALAFESDDVSVEVEVSGERGALKLLGQLAPGQAADIDVHQRGRTTTVRADHLGRFTVRGLGRGPVQLRCRFDGGAEVCTDWVAI